MKAQSSPGDGVSQPALVIRADANVAIGTGHVMRCLALAHAWQDSGGRCVFVMAQSTSALQNRLREQGIVVERLEASDTFDARRTAQIARELHAEWIVVDGYQFGSAYQSAIKAAGAKLLFIDDHAHSAPYSADLVLNQNLQARRELYTERDAATRLLLGPRYTLLRREFRSSGKFTRENPVTARKILITMGGSDPDNVTAKAIQAVQSLSGLQLETTILMGGSNPHVPSVEKLIDGQNGFMRLVVDSPDVAKWMAWADLAISGAGTTFWEICFFGLPSLLLVLASNQEGVAESAERMQIAWSLGKQSNVNVETMADKINSLIDSPETRAAQSANGRKLVDGRGAERVIAFLSDLKLRQTMDSDCELFWHWANDPEARAASFREDAISWEQHAQWFQSKRKDSAAVLYTATNSSGTPMGQVRYQVEGARSVLSISLGAAFRGRGWGQKILTLAIAEFFQEFDAEFIDAYVKPINQASLKLFENAGFLRLPPEVIDGHLGIRFVLPRFPQA